MAGFAAAWLDGNSRSPIIKKLPNHKTQAVPRTRRRPARKNHQKRCPKSLLPSPSRKRQSTRREAAGQRKRISVQEHSKAGKQENSSEMGCEQGAACNRQQNKQSKQNTPKECER